MIGLDRAVEFGPGGLDDALLGRAKRVQHRHRLVADRFIDRQLDVRQHPVRVRVGHQKRTPLTCSGGRELVAVDEADAGLHGVDAEAGPCNIEERHRWAQITLDVVTVEQVANCALEHQRRARHRVQDLAMFDGGCHEHLGDLGVDVVEGVRSVVEVIERRRSLDEIGRWMDLRAQVAVGGAGDLVAGLDGHVVVAARSETDDDDPRSTAPIHRQPRGTTWPVVASNVP